MRNSLVRFFGWSLSLAVLLVLASCAHQPEESGTEAASSATAQEEVSRPAANVAVAGGALFDGKTLTGWQPTDFAGAGSVTVTNGEIHLGMGYMTGINWTGAVPEMNYEISLEAMRTDGSDFFCGLTFPVGTEPCSFIVGGWGGGVVGLSSIDGEDASQNETTQFMQFQNNRWYKIRLRVEPARIQAWIDEEQVVNFETADRRFSVRLEVEASRPLGIATWNTAAALRNLQLKRL